MDMIFFGPPSSFLRIDAETILHILINTKKNLIPISRALLAWDVVTGKHSYRLQHHLQSPIVFSNHDPIEKFQQGPKDLIINNNNLTI